MKYIQSAIKNKSDEGCIFCTKPQASEDDKNFIIMRDKTCFALMNLFPYNSGHLMVAPYKHTGELDDLTETELTDLMVLTRRCKRLLTIVLKPEPSISASISAALRALASPTTCIFTSCRAGTGTPISCPSSVKPR